MEFTAAFLACTVEVSMRSNRGCWGGDTEGVRKGEMGVLKTMRQKNTGQDRGPEAGD